uniref:Uncharacterized protein n=1 Tax=Opuntia streptacantha TaxID=393608 RepID=A0A7C8YLP9_OPUST
MTGLLIIIGLLILSFIFTHLTLCANLTSTSKHHLGFKTYPILGSLPEFLANRHRFLDWTTDVLASHSTHTAVFFRPGRVHGIMTAFPDNVSISSRPGLITTRRDPASLPSSATSLAPASSILTASSGAASVSLLPSLSPAAMSPPSSLMLFELSSLLDYFLYLGRLLNRVGSLISR